MKKIYEFTILKKELTDQKETSKNEAGEEITITKKITKEIPHKYFIKRPSRQESDDGEVFRAATESEYMRRGVISASLLQRRIVNDGGVLTEEEKKEYENQVQSFISKQTEYAELNKIDEKERNEEQNKKIAELINELGKIMTRMNEIENSSASLYNRTAEALARNKTCLYLTLMLSYEDAGNKNVPVFGEGDYDKKLSVYDSMEEREDQFEYKLIQKLLFLVSMYYMGKATTKDEFETAEKIFDNQETLNLAK